MEKNNRELIIRPFEEGDWQAICRIHDEARMIELQYAGLEQAFLPLWIAADREWLFDYTVEVAELDGSVAGFSPMRTANLAGCTLILLAMDRGSEAHWSIEHATAPESP